MRGNRKLPSKHSLASDISGAQTTQRQCYHCQLMDSVRLVNVVLKKTHVDWSDL